MKIQSVAILGAGAVGSYVIWGLSQKEEIELGVIAEGERKERLQQNGCKINGKVYRPNVWTPKEACGVDLLIVALKYGAKQAFGTDLDPNAIIASEENAEQNNIDKKQLEVIEGNIIDDKNIKDRCGYECYDIVCANILADVLEPLSVNIHEHMKHGAYFITSGIINTKEDEVVNAFKKNSELEIVEINHDGEWVNVTARRK